MTDATEGAPAPPKKAKRSIFKKSAWEKPKVEGTNDVDIFSHSNDFGAIVAEKARRQKEEAAKKAKVQKHDEEERKRQLEEHAAKKRRLNLELAEQTERSGGSTRSGGSKKSSKGDSSRTGTPLSPEPEPQSKEHSPHSPARRYNILTRASSTFLGTPPKTRSNTSNIVDLNDSYFDSEYEVEAPKHKLPTRVAKSPKLAPTYSDEIEEVEDPVFARLIEQARAKRRAEEAAKAASKGEASSTPTTNGMSSSVPEKKAGVVSLLIESDIEGTIPLLIKIRVSDTLHKPLQAWCNKQGFSQEMKDAVFFTWKDMRIYNSTTIRRLGVKEEEGGYLSVEGDDNMYSENDPPKIHLRVWTPELYGQYEKEKAVEAQAKRKAAQPPKLDDQPERVPEPAVRKIKLLLKAQGKETFKITVNPDTTFEHLTFAYRKARGIAADQPLTLYFDGDRLSPMDNVADADIDDLDQIEVHFK